MSSSTFSFSVERKVVCAICVGFLAVEVALRFLAPYLSKDLVAIRNFPQIAEELSQANAEGSETVLFLGNSMVREDIDIPTLRSVLDSKFTQHRYFKCMADGTMITDWYYTFRRYFVRPDRTPDIVVVCFSGGADGTLGDIQPTRARKLARNFCATADIPEAISKDLRTNEEVFAFLLARASVAFATRERIQSRILAELIPGYRVNAQRLNAAARAESQGTISPSQQVEFRRLGRFAELARLKGIRVIAVAMPLRGGYDLPPSLSAFCRAHRWGLVEAQDFEQITPDMIPDGFHLTKLGAPIFTRELANRLAKVEQFER